MVSNGAHCWCTARGRWGSDKGRVVVVGHEHRRRTSACALSLALAVALAGCTEAGNARETPSSSPTELSPTPTAAPTPSVDPAIAVAETAVLEAYRGFWAAKVSWFADPSVDNDSGLSHYAIDTALADTQSAVFSFRTDGIEVPGEPVLSPVVSNLVLGAVPSATVDDCVDLSNWQAIFRDSREPAVAPGQLTRIVAVSEATVFDGRWVVRNYLPQRNRTC